MKFFYTKIIVPFFSIENLWSLELLGIGKCSSLSMFLLFLDTGGND